MSTQLRIGAVKGNTFSADYLNSGQDAASSDTDAHDIPVPQEERRPTQTYPGCFGLSYQDHNYGAQPPLSPTPPKSPPPPVPKVSGAVELEEETKVPAVSNEEEVVEDSITRCICGFLHDDGYMICCDKCSVWQHIDCMEIDRNNIPENYCCEICEPRNLDVDRAKMIQLRKREEIDTSATDTDPEEPANALASLGRRPVQPKPKGSKQRRVTKAGARLLKTAKLAKGQQLKKLKLTKKEKENVKDASKKVKVGKTGVPKQKKLKKKLNTSLAQNKADFWTPVVGPFCSVDDVHENEYSPEILEFLSHVKTNGIHSPHSIGVFPEELLVRLYQVTDIKKNCKGLEATDLIIPGRAVIEFKGKVMLRQHYQQDPLLKQSQPYVLYYSKFEGLDLCIDASAFGGDARFIRRSCTPNAEMCHIIDNGNLHFIVQAKKEIAKGSEITIPFDFSYQDSLTCVECACGRGNCPVAKFWKKAKLAQKSPEKTKRKRQASGEGRVRRDSQSKGSPAKGPSGTKSPVKSPAKSPVAVTPLSFSLDECSVSMDSTASADSLSTVSPPLKTAPIPRRSSRSASDAKEERDVKASRTSQSKEPSGKGAATQEEIHVVDIQCPIADVTSAHHASESEMDSTGECPKKMTREERKMEAIMKAFEKLAKREERRKEALARLDKKHDFKEEHVDRSHNTETSSEDFSESGGDRSSDHQPLPDAASQSPDTESKIIVKLEEPPPVIESPQKTSRHRRMRRKRRSSRAMSAFEPLFSSHVKVVPEEPPLPSVEEVKVKEEEPAEPQLTCHSTPNPVSQDSEASNPDLTDSYMLIKKKKTYLKWLADASLQYLVNDRGGPRCADLRSESLDEHTTREEMFVAYTPGPRSTIDHIQRRNSTSATYGRPQDGAGGNAKKRWLRQAMYERGPPKVETTSSPVSNGCVSPPHPTTPASASAPPTATNTSLPSPTGSPSDFVTPLKKRRLAPEFLPSLSSAGDCTSHSTSEPSLLKSVNIEVSGSFTPTSVLAAPVDSRPVSQTADTRPVSQTEYSRPHLQVVENRPSSEAETRSVLNSIETRPVSLTPPSHVQDPQAGTAGTRLPIKVSRLFGKRSKKGSAGGSPDSAVSDGPFPGSSGASLGRPLGSGLLSSSRLEELSLDGLSSSSSSARIAGSSATATTCGCLDSAEVSEGSSGSPGTAASSSSVMWAVNSNNLGMELPLVDSSGAALDTDLPETAQQRVRGSDSVSVCSSDNEVSVCVHSADSEHHSDSENHSDRGSTQVVAESSSVCNDVGLRSPQDQDGNVTESQRADESMEIEDEGNEASGSVSGSEDPVGASGSSNCAPSHPSADCCQVNSSQDSPWTNRLPPPSCSPTLREAECNNPCESAQDVNRTCDSWRVSTGQGESRGSAVSSALDNGGGDRDRTGVSSAQDIADVSSALSVRHSDRLAMSDVDCGPSSSTQILGSRHLSPENRVCNSSSSAVSLRHRQVDPEDMVCNSSSTPSLRGRQIDMAEDMVCNSSDVTGSDVVRTVCEEDNVDSTTTQSGRVVRSDPDQCDTADSQVELAESEGSCCDSNSDEQAHPAFEGEGAGVSSSGPADSQWDQALDTGQQGVCASSGVVSSSATVSSTQFSSSHTDTCLSSMAAMASSSTLSTTSDVADLPGPSQSTSGTSPSVSNSFSGADSASLDPSAPLVTSAAATTEEGRESDSVGTSEQSSSSTSLMLEPCETRNWRLSDNWIPSPRPASSSLPQSQGEGEVSVSSMAAALDSQEERVVVNGDVTPGGLVSSFSEDSSGSNSTSNPCATVSSSEAQAAPAVRRKVSLSEYRNRRKEKSGCAATTSSSTSPKSSADNQTHSGRGTVHSSISLTPLPLFEPIRERDMEEQEKEKREKPMSLSDRLRIEFGLETTSEEEKTNSTGHRKVLNGIPPPPPLPPNGMTGGVGVRRPISTGSWAGSTENEDDSRQGSSSSFARKPMLASATATSLGSSTSFPSTSSAGIKHAAGGQSSLQPGYSWLAKLHSGRQAAPLPPSATSVYGPNLMQQQPQPQPPYNGSNTGAPHLANGSHAQPPTSAAFSSGAMYQSPPPGQPQPFTATSAAAASAKQQQAPPPPPPPSTAYSPFVAQSRTHSFHPQTSPQQLPRGQSSSLSHVQRSSSSVSSVENGAGRVRHTAADPSSNHSLRRHNFDQYSHIQTVKHKGSYGPVMKRH